MEEKKLEVKAYVERFRDYAWDIDTLSNNIFVNWFVAILALVFGIFCMDEGAQIIPLVLGIISVILVLILHKYINSVKQRGEEYITLFLNTGMDAWIFSLQFLILALMIPVMNNMGIEIVLCVIGIYILFYIIAICITLIRIGKGFYSSKIKSVKPSRVGIGSAGAGGVLGISLGRIIFPRLDYEVSMLIGIALCLSLALLTVVAATMYLLRACYVKKYGLTDPYPQKKKTTRKPKKTTEKEQKQEKAITEKTEQ